MFVSDLEVYNFRCHEKIKVKFSETKTLIRGLNGSGKTSLIEAVYLLLRGKSFRGYDLDVLKLNQAWYKAVLNLNLEDKTERRELRFQNRSSKIKEFVIDNKKTQRLSNHKKVPVVLFQPDDLNLINGSPSRRRSFFDNIISQLQPEHATYLNRYEKVLRQRNNLLKKHPEATLDDLFSWHVMLANYGSKIIQNRLDSLEKIQAKLKETYQEITGKADELSITYSEKYPDKNQIEAQLFSKLNKNLEASIGPQREDFVIEFNYNLASQHSSRGEVRSIVLSLKIIEASLIFEAFGSKPIILLDDVLSELDEQRRHALMSHISHNQIIMTSTEEIDLEQVQVINI